MRFAVRLIDRWLRACNGVFEYTNDPQCILRAQLTHVNYAMKPGAVRISKGDMVVALHVWNEKAPRIPPGGADIDWALKLRRQLVYSLRLLAEEMIRNGKYTGVQAVCGTSALFSTTDHIGGVRMMQHLGFTVIPYHRPFGRFGEFWENLFSWWLMWTFNTASLDRREFFHLQRTEIWMSAEDFIHRYAARD